MTAQLVHATTRQPLHQETIDLISMPAFIRDMTAAGMTKPEGQLWQRCRLRGKVILKGEIARVLELAMHVASAAADRREMRQRLGGTPDYYKGSTMFGVASSGVIRAGIRIK